MIAKTNIWLIDDDKLFVFLTRKIIHSTGIPIQVMDFNDGESAIEYLKGLKGSDDQLPDVIFLDLSMPVLDGWGFLDEYIQMEGELHKKIRIYILSSSISPHDVERSRTVPVVADFLVKPLVKENLAQLLA